MDGLKNAADEELQEIAVSCRQAVQQGIPLPFPITEEETELCSNEKSIRELGMAYTAFEEGMAKTYRAFKGVYAG